MGNEEVSIVKTTRSYIEFDKLLNYPNSLLSKNIVEI